MVKSAIWLESDILGGLDIVWYMATGLFKMSPRLKGTLYSIAGILVLSPDSLCIRLVGDVEPWTVQFYRYMLQGLVLLAYYLLATRGDLRKFTEIGWIGVLAGLVWGASNLLFTMAIQTTAVGNVLVILAGGNLTFSALLSLAILRERVPLYTVAACCVCFAAIMLVFSDQLEGRTNSLGNVLAIFAALTLALYFVLVRLAGIRYGKEPDMIPCNIIAGVFVGLVALICGARPASVTPSLPCLYLVLQGCFLLSISFALMTAGASLISAPEMSMFMLLETLLGPVWVFLGGYEAPPALTVWGGILLVVSLAVHSLLALRDQTAEHNPALEDKAEASEEAGEGTDRNHRYIDLTLVKLEDGKDGAGEA